MRYIFWISVVVVALALPTISHAVTQAVPFTNCGQDSACKNLDCGGDGPAWCGNAVCKCPQSQIKPICPLGARCGDRGYAYTAPPGDIKIDILECRGANTGSTGGVLGYCFTLPKASCVPQEGKACESLPNVCGMTRKGTFNCDGTCSASKPSNNLCDKKAEGTFDSIDCSVAIGTAFDQTYSGPVNVLIGKEASPFSQVTADSPKPNWFFPIPASYRDGVTHTISAYVRDVLFTGEINPTGVIYALTGSPKTLTCTELSGTFDSASCTVDAGGALSILVSGTAQDPESTTGVAVHIYSNGASIGSGIADQDTKAFSFSVGASEPPLLDGNPRSYTLRAYGEDIPTGTYYELPIDQTITCNPSFPTASILSVAEPDYCQSGPDATVTWEYTSPGLPQGAWQLEIATDAAFSNIIYDSGKVLAEGPRSKIFGFFSRAVRSILALLGFNEQARAATVTSQHSASVGPGILQFASSYYARVQVWDNTDQASLGWSGVYPFSISATGPYPQAQFSFQPSKPAAGQEIQFTDESSGGPTAWSWNFGDGGTSPDQNPVYTYTASGSYTTTLQVTNAYGSCQTARTIGTQQAIPNFKEVRP